MNSNEFFLNHTKKWNGKQGIYVIENPLFKVEGKRIFKIGYARDSLTKRISDYRTAYSPLIPFTIHLLYEVPEATGGKRANYALLTEAIVHQTLKKMGKWADAEWFYDLDAIIDTISSVRIRHLKEISFADKWVFYSTHLSTKAVSPVEEDSIRSSLKDLITMTTEEKKKRFRNGKTVNIGGRVLKIPKTYIDVDGREVEL